MAESGNPSGAFVVVLPTIAALLFLAALIAIISALALLFPGPEWRSLWNLNPRAYESFHSMGRGAVWILFVVGSIAAAIGAGLMLRKRWAWWLALILFAINGAGDLVSLIRTREVLRFGFGALIAAAFIWLLAVPRVRRSLS